MRFEAIEIEYVAELIIIRFLLKFFHFPRDIGILFNKIVFRGSNFNKKLQKSRKLVPRKKFPLIAARQMVEGSILVNFFEIFKLVSVEKILGIVLP